IDPYAIWAKRAREKGVSPWLSIRMNDVHDAQNPNSGLHGSLWRRHPEWRRVPTSDGKRWTDAAMDYSHPEVRETYIGYVGEMLQRYDVDGVEIDWLRFPHHLTPGLEPSQTNCLNEVMRAVRAHADAAAKKWGHPVKVGARVETAEETCLKLGEDPVHWAQKKWIDWLVVCNFFTTVNFDIPYREWAQRIHAVNPEVTIVPGLDSGVVKDRALRQYLTLAEYRGFCENLYAQGAPGVYIFNPFHFAADSDQWRAFTTGGLAPEKVADAPRAYPVSYRECCVNGAPNCMQLPRKLSAPVRVRIPIGAVPAKGEAELALAFNVAVSNALCSQVTLNGVAPTGWRRIEPTSFLHAKTAAKGAALLRYPRTALKAGHNVVDIPAEPRTDGGSPCTVIACELYLGGGERHR
ncbi:MAG: family 10 glycosylhydrolase, partial [Kiritimatiellae bacterium]|nr:family 10 glycosylhydrolase [Kiritimatiellia bacterium]